MKPTEPSPMGSLLRLEVPADLLERLAVRYAEPHRRYHTWAHVAACLEARAQLTEAAIPEVELALLFHDAIYAPLAPDNEARSAALLVEEGRRAWLSESLLRRAANLVLATRHTGAADLPAEAGIVVDADLAILAVGPAAFDRYELQIRAEFSEVDDAAFAAGRSQLLQRFLDAPAIYVTARGRRLWERRARENLTRSLNRWRQGGRAS